MDLSVAGPALWSPPPLRPQDCPTAESDLWSLPYSALRLLTDLHGLENTSPGAILKNGVLQWQIAGVRHRTWWHLSALLCSPFSHYLLSAIDTDVCIFPSLKYFIVSLLQSHNFLKYPIVGLLMPLRFMVILLPLPYQLKSFGGTCRSLF